MGPPVCFLVPRVLRGLEKGALVSVLILPLLLHVAAVAEADQHFWARVPKSSNHSCGLCVPAEVHARL